MNSRTYLIQTVTLIAAAVLCALVSNAMASRERQMKLHGYYPNAQKVPPRETSTPAPIAPAVTTTTTMAQTPAATATVAPAPTPAPAPLPVATTPAQAPPAAKPLVTAPVTKDDPLKKFAPHEKQPYIEIAYADVKLLHDRGVMFFDARRTSVYEQGHIAGARAMPVWESDIDDRVAKFFNERSDAAQQALPIVVYCSGGDCEDSHMLAQKLFQAYYTNVYVYKDGFPDWQKHGGDVHVGAEP